MQKQSSKLVRNGVLPHGKGITTWRLPLAAEIKVQTVGADHLNNMLEAMSISAPDLADTILNETCKRIIAEVDRQRIAITRSLTMTMPPAPVLIKDHASWKKEVFDDEAAMANL